MKKILLIASICVSQFIKGQAPQAIPYQAVARDNSGIHLPNQTVSLRFSIRDLTAAGTVIYQETHSTITNSSGLFSVNIGQGTVISGTFTAVKWGGGLKFMQVETDFSGGTNYIDMGTQQMMSVPYSLHSQTANMITPYANNTGTFSMISNPIPGNISFWEAMDFCYNSAEGGFTDWRLPTFEEVEKYVELNGLPSSTFITITQSIIPSSLNQIVVVLRDFSNAAGTGNINMTTAINSFALFAYVQCVR